MRPVTVEEFLEQFGRDRRAALRGLRVIVDARRTLDRIESLLAARARGGGASWRDIGEALGISRQAAFMRHRAAVKPTDGDSPRPFC